MSGVPLVTTPATADAPEQLGIIAAITAGMDDTLGSVALLADLTLGEDFSSIQVALIALAIVFGVLGLSHVNDSGFRVVTRHLGLSRSPTVRGPGRS